MSVGGNQNEAITPVEVLAFNYHQPYPMRLGQLALAEPVQNSQKPLTQTPFLRLA